MPVDIGRVKLYLLNIHTNNELVVVFYINDYEIINY